MFEKILEQELVQLKIQSSKIAAIAKSKIGIDGEARCTLNNGMFKVVFRQRYIGSLGSEEYKFEDENYLIVLHKFNKWIMKNTVKIQPFEV